MKIGHRGSGLFSTLTKPRPKPEAQRTQQHEEGNYQEPVSRLSMDAELLPVNNPSLSFRHLPIIGADREI